MPRAVASALYEKVRKEIMRRVFENEYEVGTPLPSAAKFAEEFGVSNITIKRALRDLQHTGLLRSFPGLGTFVRERRMFIHDLGFPFASFGDAQRLGLKQGVHLLSVTRERIHQSLFSEFETPTEKMHCVRNIISADGTPIMIDTSYLPPSFSNSVGDLGGKLASDALRDHGEHFHTARILVAANPASDEAQKAFAIPNGYPTLRRIYQLTTSNSSLSIFGISESPFDCLACLVELEVSK